MTRILRKGKGEFLPPSLLQTDVSIWNSLYVREIEPPYVAHDIPELAILLPQSPKCWGDRYATSGF